MRPELFPSLLSLLVLAPAAAVGQPQPSLAFEPSAVVVSDVSPEAPIVLFYVGRQGGVDDGVVRVIRGEAVLTADAGGLGRFEVAGGVPPASLWAVVELKSGAYSIAAPDGRPLKEVAFAVDGLQADGQGRFHLVKDFRESLEVLYVRPGGGAWVQSVRDGVGRDKDAVEDGSLSLSLDDLRALEGSPVPPRQFEAGDLLIAFDADRLELFAFRFAS